MEADAPHDTCSIDEEGNVYYDCNIGDPVCAVFDAAPDDQKAARRYGLCS